MPDFARRLGNNKLNVFGTVVRVANRTTKRTAAADGVFHPTIDSRGPPRLIEGWKSGHEAFWVGEDIEVESPSPGKQRPRQGSLRELIYAIDAIDVCKDRADAANERADKNGSPVAGSFAIAFARQCNYWAQQADVAIDTFRQLVGAETLRTICTACGDLFNGKSARRFAAIAALRNRMSSEAFLDLGAEYAVELMATASTNAAPGAVETSSSLRTERIRQIHQRFVTAGVRWRDLRFAAARPLRDTLPDWPQVPTGEPGEMQIGVDEGTWKRLFDAWPDAPYSIVDECWFEFEGVYWNGVFYDGSVKCNDSQTRHEQLKEGVEVFQTLAQSAAAHFGICRKVSLDWAPLVRRNPAHAWLAAVCLHAGVTRYEDKALYLIVLPGDIFTASARAIEVVAEIDELAMARTKANPLAYANTDANVGTPVSVPPTAELACSKVAVVDGTAGESQLSTFVGGEMVFLTDRVELCGTDICSGLRNQNFRIVLDTLRGPVSGDRQRFGASELADALGRPGDIEFAVGVVRNLRERISRELGRHAGFACADNDVIVRDEQGYGLAATISVSVQFEAGQTMPAEHGQNNEDGGTEDGNVRDLNVLDVPNVRDQIPALLVDVRDLGSAVAQNVRDPLAIVEHDVRARGESTVSGDTPGGPGDRTSWIVCQLASGRLLSAPEMARELGCSVKTIQRDLESLKRKITFVGHARTGHYRLLDQGHDGESTTPSSS